MKSSSDIPKDFSMNVIPERSYRESHPTSPSQAEQLSFSDTLNATVERIREKGEERVRTAPRCAVCGESIFADEPLGAADSEQWTLYNATHNRLCIKHFRVKYEKIKLSCRLQDADHRLIGAGVSAEFSTRSFENFMVTDSNRQFFTMVKTWSENPSSFLSILSQHTGIGKTHLAIAALRQHYISTGILGRFRKERDILLEIRKGYGTHTGLSENEVIESLSKPEFLVIDDLFSSHDPNEGNEFARRIALAITDEREWQGRTTIITGNLTLSDIAAIDARISSRLSAGLVLNVQSVDKDFRPTLHKPALSLSKEPALSLPKGPKSEGLNE